MSIYIGAEQYDFGACRVFFTQSQGHKRDFLQVFLCINNEDQDATFASSPSEHTVKGNGSGSNHKEQWKKTDYTPCWHSEV